MEIARIGDPERQVRVVGPFQARRDGHLLRLPHSVERVLAHVALIGPLARTRVGSVLWPDADPSRASANLRSALSRLGLVDSGYLVFSGDVVSLADTVAVDLDDLLAWVNATIYDTPQIGVVAVVPPPLSVGKQLLPGWNEEWLTDIRERHQLLQTQALETVAERLLLAGRPAAALSYALAAVEAQPWSESANLLVIEIHARRGDRSNALRRFRRFRGALHAELGVQPGPDVLAAMRQLYPFGILPPDAEETVVT